MTCYHPLTAYKYKHRVNIESGKPVVSFNFGHILSEFGQLWHDHVEEIKVPCGHCIGCRLDQARAWAIRICHENALYASSIFLTLTYNDDGLKHLKCMSNLKDKQVYYSLCKRDLQLFMKRLRKKFGAGIRFYGVGEYGSLNQRPHFHVIVFNLDLPDAEVFSRNGGNPIYRSAELERLWPFGYSCFGRVSFDSACYVSRYCTKKITGDVSEVHYFGREKEFSLMSRRPGIGAAWFEKFSSDVYNYDVVILKNLKLRPPKYYDKLFEKYHPDEMKVIKEKRKIKALSSEIDNARLKVLEKSCMLRLKNKKRRLEEI